MALRKERQTGWTGAAEAGAVIAKPAEMTSSAVTASPSAILFMSSPLVRFLRAAVNVRADTEAIILFPTLQDKWPVSRDSRDPHIIGTFGGHSERWAKRG